MCLHHEHLRAGDTTTAWLYHERIAKQKREPGHHLPSGTEQLPYIHDCDYATNVPTMQKAGGNASSGLVRDIATLIASWKLYPHTQTSIWLGMLGLL